MLRLDYGEMNPLSYRVFLTCVAQGLHAGPSRVVCRCERLFWSWPCRCCSNAHNQSVHQSGVHTAAACPLGDGLQHVRVVLVEDHVQSGLNSSPTVDRRVGAAWAITALACPTEAVLLLHHPTPWST